MGENKTGKEGRSLVTREFLKIIRRITQTLNEDSKEVRDQAVCISEQRSFQKTGNLRTLSREKTSVSEDQRGGRCGCSQQNGTEGGRG